MRIFRQFLLAAAITCANGPTFAVGLSEADYAYLASQHGLDRNSKMLQGLSPREQATLHGLVYDATIAIDSKRPNEIIADTLAEFLKHQNWEKENPGRLWDSPKR
jgi:hypothetical protein